MSNPLISRYQKSTMRPKQLLIFISIYIISVGIIASINYSGLKYGGLYESWEEMFRSVFGQVTFIQLLVIWGWSAFNSGSAIREEILGNSYDFFKMLPLSAFKKASGILIGKNLFVFVLAGINFVLMWFSGWFGGLSGNLLFQSTICILAIAFFINSLSLLFSIQPDRRRKNKSNIIAIIFFIFIVLPMLGNLIGVLVDREHDPENYNVLFYNIEIPVIVSVSLCAVYFGFWFFKGILRRFTYERQPLFTRNGAIIFMFIYFVIVMGFFNRYLNSENMQLRYGFWVFTLCPVFVVYLFSCRNFDSYIQTAGYYKTNGFKGLFKLFKSSNIALALVLFALWSGFAIISSIQELKYVTEAYMSYDLLIIVVLLLFYMVVISLFEVYVVVEPLANKITFLVGFLILLYLFLPLISAGVFDNENLIVYSAFGIFGMLINEQIIYGNQLLNVSIMNGLILAVTGFIIIKRYLFALSARNRMAVQQVEIDTIR